MKPIAVAGIAFVAAFGLSAAADQAVAANIEIVRGDHAETIALPVAAKLTVLKGEGAAVEEVSDSPRRSQRAHSRWTVVGGNRAWLINPRTGEVVLCQWRYSSTVGEDGIQCVTDSIYQDDH